MCGEDLCVKLTLWPSLSLSRKKFQRLATLEICGFWLALPRSTKKSTKNNPDFGSRPTCVRHQHTPPHDISKAGSR